MFGMVSRWADGDQAIGLRNMPGPWSRSAVARDLLLRFIGPCRKVLGLGPTANDSEQGSNCTCTHPSKGRRRFGRGYFVATYIGTVKAVLRTDGKPAAVTAVRLHSLKPAACHFRQEFSSPL